MTFPKFVSLLVALLVAAALLIWVLVSLAALVYALTQGDGGAAGTYAMFTAVGLVVCVLAAWAVRRVARTRPARQ